METETWKCDGPECTKEIPKWNKHGDANLWCSKTCKRRADKRDRNQDEVY